MLEIENFFLRVMGGIEKVRLGNEPPKFADIFTRAQESVHILTDQHAQVWNDDKVNSVIALLPARRVYPQVVYTGEQPPMSLRRLEMMGAASLYRLDEEHRTSYFTVVDYMHTILQFGSDFYLKRNSSDLAGSLVSNFERLRSKAT